MPTATANPPDGSRLVSLDALRGFDMLMIVGADALATGLDRTSDAPAVRMLVEQFTHRPWEGFAFYDLIGARSLLWCGWGATR